MPLGVYVQVPFCQTKCTYCNFHTGVVSRDRYRPYVDAVCRDISDASASSTESVDTVYVGGGTPSLLDTEDLARLLHALVRSFPGPRVEVTLEADPETVTPERTAAWQRAGFNRISLGAQSFQDVELQNAGRLHRREDIFRAVDLLRSAGLSNVSLDLIAGLPHQTRASWEDSVSQLLRIYPDHVSVYMLEIDEGSRLGRESLAGGSRYAAGAIPSDDDMADFYECAARRLADAGYHHYEISNWGLPGRESLHNLKYWRREAYLGFGAGAHSFDGIARWANVHEPVRYTTLIERGATAREQFEVVSPAQALAEEFFLGLRQIEGIDIAPIEQRSDPSLGLRWETLHQRIDTLQSHGLVKLEGTRLRIAPNRLTISNEVFLELLG